MDMKAELRQVKKDKERAEEQRSTILKDLGSMEAVVAEHEADRRKFRESKSKLENQRDKLLEQVAEQKGANAAQQQLIRQHELELPGLRQSAKLLIEVQSESEKLGVELMSRRQHLKTFAIRTMLTNMNAGPKEQCVLDWRLEMRADKEHQRNVSEMQRAFKTVADAIMLKMRGEKAYVLQ